MTYSQLSRLERGRAQTRGIKKPERRRHKLAFTVAKITKDTEVMPLANEQGAFAPGRMTFRPAFPQQPRLADELAGFIGAGGKKKRHRRTKLQMNRTQSVGAGGVELEIDVK